MANGMQEKTYVAVWHTLLDPLFYPHRKVPMGELARVVLNTRLADLYKINCHKQR